METIIYLTLKRKENAGGTKDEPPIFSIREKTAALEEEDYRILYVDVPNAMLKEPAADRSDQSHDSRNAEMKQGKDRRGESLSQEEPVRLAGWLSRILFRGEKSTVQKDADGQEQCRGRKRFGRRKQQDVTGRHPEDEQCQTGMDRSAERAQRRQEAIRLNMPWIRELAQYLVPYQLQSSICHMVYDDSVDKWLKKYDMCGWWEENWAISEFRDYHATAFARKLMDHAHLPNFLVLGYDPCVPGLLAGHARHMKSLSFILGEMPEELEEFLEDFYDEYGLAAACRVAQGQSLRGERIRCVFPAVILDFSKESRLLTADVAKGSVWLDMDSLEEKRRRIEERNTGIYYFSMKKEWKQGKVHHT